MKLRKLLLMFMILLIVVPLASAVNVAFSCSAVPPTQVDCTFSYAGNTPGVIPPSTNFDTGWAVSLNVNSGSYALAQSNFQNNPPSSTLLYNPTGNPQVNMVSVADLGPSGNFFVLRFTGVTTGSNTIVLNNILLFDENSDPVPGTTSTLSSTVTVGAAPPAPSCASVVPANSQNILCDRAVSPIAANTPRVLVASCSASGAVVACTYPCTSGFVPSADRTSCVRALGGACGAANAACTRSCYTGSTCDATGTICQGGNQQAAGTGCFLPGGVDGSCNVAGVCVPCTARLPTACTPGVGCPGSTVILATGCPAGQSCQSGSCQAVLLSPCASATWDCSRTVGSCAGVTVGDTLEFRQHRDCDLSNSVCLSDAATPPRPASFVLCPKSGAGAPTAAERLVGHMKSIAEGLQYPVDGSTVSPGTPNSATVVYDYKTLESNDSTAILRKTAALARAIFGALRAT